MSIYQGLVDFVGSVSGSTTTYTSTGSLSDGTLRQSYSQIAGGPSAYRGTPMELDITQVHREVGYGIYRPDTYTTSSSIRIGYQIYINGLWNKIPESHHDCIGRNLSKQEWLRILNISIVSKQISFFKLLVGDITPKECYNILKNKQNEVEQENGTTAYTTARTWNVGSDYFF